MKHFRDPRALLFILIPVMLAWAPHDGEGGPKDVGSSSPAGIGGDGPWKASNVLLLSRLALDEIGSGGASNVLGSDCWGWTDPLDDREYAICCLTNGTSFIDITDPTAPQYLGKLPTHTGNAAWRDVKVYQNHCFVVSDGNDNHGMQVFDLTQLRTADRENPTTFSNTNWYDEGIQSAHNIAINEQTGYAYIVGCSQADGGLHVVDVSNPGNPVFAGNFAGDGYTHDVQVVSYSGPDSDYAGREIAFACNEDTVTIVDVTDKSQMTMISRNAYADDEYTHQGWLSEDQRYFYMGDELDERNQGGLTKTHIFDCQDLDNVTYEGYMLGSTGAIDHNLYVKDNYAYEANYSAGLRVIDLGNDPSEMTEVAFFDSYNTDTAPDFDGVWSCYPYFPSGSILMNDRQNGMFIVRVAPIKFRYGSDPPRFLQASGGVVEMTLIVEDFLGTAAMNSAVLYVDRGEGFEPYPLALTGPNQYDVVFPETTAGSLVRYYFSADATDGTTVCSPISAPTDVHSAVSVESVSVAFADDFETDQGWTVAGDAADGSWERGVPAGNGFRGDPTLDADGSGSCFLTGNANGNSDVDDGVTIITSPVMDATGLFATDAVISYWRWYTNDAGGNAAADIFEVEITNDGGENWVAVETVGPTGNEISGGWIRQMFLVNDLVERTDQMQVRFTASDLNKGSVVEAGVDGVEMHLVNAPIDVPPDAVDIVFGALIAGSVDDLATSNNQYLKVNGRVKQSPGIEFEVQAQSPTSNPVRLQMTIESSQLSFPSLVTEVVRLYDFDAGTFVEIGRRNQQPVRDRSFVCEPEGDLSRFVEPGTGLVRARLQYNRFNLNRGFQRFKTKVDLISWEFLE
ncbi:MAG: choice-of-anchor B family protein [Mariniblastus sp.]|nr:choice-of-anchor B family protein [Mariniblastus sp.]